MNDNLELLSEARIANDVQRNKLVNVGILQQMADHIAHEDLEYPASAVVIITLGPDGPNVVWRGIGSVDQLKDAARAMQAVDAAYRFPRAGYTPESPTEVARSDADRRKKGRVALDRIAEQKRAETPWRCDHCDSGFKTERGAKMHEAKSEKKGCPRCKRPWCVMSGVAYDGSGNLNWCQKCEFTGDPQYVKPSETVQLVSGELGLVRGTGNE